MVYKPRKDSLNSGGRMLPLFKVLTVVGSGDPLETHRPKKTGLRGYQ